MTEIKGPRPLCAPTGRRIVGAQVTVTAVREVEKIYADERGHTIAEYGSGLKFDPLSEKAEMVGPHLIFVDEDGCGYQCVDLIEGPCDDDPPNPNSLH